MSTATPATHSAATPTSQDTFPAPLITSLKPYGYNRIVIVCVSTCSCLALTTLILSILQDQRIITTPFPKIFFLAQYFLGWGFSLPALVQNYRNATIQSHIIETLRIPITPSPQRTYTLPLHPSLTRHSYTQFMLTYGALLWLIPIPIALTLVALDTLQIHSSFILFLFTLCLPFLLFQLKPALLSRPTEPIATLTPEGIQTLIHFRTRLIPWSQISHITLDHTYMPSGTFYSIHCKIYTYQNTLHPTAHFVPTEAPTKLLPDFFHHLRTTFTQATYTTLPPTAKS